MSCVEKKGDIFFSGGGGWLFIVEGGCLDVGGKKEK